MDCIIVAYSKLIPVLIEAVKELEEIITELSAKVQDLENELTLRDSLVMEGAGYSSPLYFMVSFYPYINDFQIIPFYSSKYFL
jgi:hypothetical protein